MSYRTNIMVGTVCLLAGFGHMVRGQATGAHVGAFAVIDALGRTVSFAKTPERIVVTGKASFMIANAVALFPDAGQRLVAYSGGLGMRHGAGDFMSLVRPGQAAIDVLGGDAGVEQIAATHPDVVLLKSSARRLGEVLERLGIPVVYLEFETMDCYERDLAVLGRLLGDDERAGDLIAYYRDVLAGVRNRTAAVPETGRPRTLLLQCSGRGGVVAFSVPGPEWIQTELVERAGGFPVWKETARPGGWTVVNLEQIAGWDPDIVAMVNYTDGANQAVAAIMADAKWRALRAVRNNRIVAFPGDFYSWDQPDPRWALGLIWLATRIHPRLFRATRMPREIERFYAFYGLDAATVQSNVLPLIGENLDPLHE